MPRKDPEARRAYQREHYRKNRESRLAAVKAYRAENRDEVNARRRAANKRDRPKISAAMQRWRNENPDKWRPIHRKKEALRRARLRGCEAEAIDPAVVFERDEGVCGICGGAVDPADWHMDHVVPIARGGPHVYANVQVAHPRCNSSKGAK
jgi:5-methylcytosine-specific restriction endonuclease McrA